MRILYKILISLLVENFLDLHNSKIGFSKLNTSLILNKISDNL